MKFSYTNKIRLLIIFLLLIVSLQGVIIYNMTHFDLSTSELKENIRNVIHIGGFLYFVFSMLLIFYIPVFLKGSLSHIHKILKDLSQGDYSHEIDLSKYKNELDKEFYEIVKSIKSMQEVIYRFDKKKKEKIIKNRNRLRSLLNMTESGFIILEMSGEVVYVNDAIVSNFKTITENVNIAETHFLPDIENSIKKYVLGILKTRSNQENQQFYIPSLKRHVTIKSSIIKNTKGKPVGIVIGVMNIEKKKTSKENQENSEQQDK